MNNMYDILNKLNAVEQVAQPKATSPKAKSKLAESMETVEGQLSEKYMGFKKTVAAIEKGGSAENPAAVAASIGREKYGKKKFQKAAAAGVSPRPVARLEAETQVRRNRRIDHGHQPGEGGLPSCRL